jgi:thiol-disulfide isomerase/thioredoxin
MKTNTIFALIIVVIVAVGGFFIYRSTSGPGPYDEFAQCLKDNGVKFYGAFWCPHCQAQKKLFKKSAKKLPYIECSTANGSSQLPVCTDVGIQSYPTWEFADGTRKTGDSSCFDSRVHTVRCFSVWCSRHASVGRLMVRRHMLLVWLVLPPQADRLGLRARLVSVDLVARLPRADLFLVDRLGQRR